jgi:class 3 adenylate cyclase
MPDLTLVPSQPGLRGDGLPNHVPQQRAGSAISRAREVDGRSAAAMVRFCAGLRAVLRESLGEARDLLEDAAELYRAASSAGGEAQVHLALAELEWRDGRRTHGIQAASTARLMAERIGCDVLISEAETALQQLGTRRLLTTVLMTDIVGSTELVARLGDCIWVDLLERHRATIRRQLRQHQGIDIETTGDGLLAAFESPTQSLRCASAIVEAVGKLGLELRVGIHLGECIRVGRALAGIVVHTAARITACARPGEVLVSNTVNDTVVGSGIPLDERGVYHLKGVPGEWRLFTLRPCAST